MATTVKTIKLDMGEELSKGTLTVNLEMQYRAITRLRVWLGTRLFILGAWIMGTSIEITKGPKPPYQAPEPWPAPPIQSTVRERLAPVQYGPNPDSIS